MRFAALIIVLVCSFCLIECKKNSGIDPSDGTNVDSLIQSIIYKTIATIPSPNDSAKGLLRDSVSVFRRIGKNDPNWRTNIPNVSSYLVNNIGFSIGYDYPTKPFPYFSFSSYAFPDVPRGFLLNKTYAHESIRGTVYQRPMYLGSHSGFDGMTYFVDNVYPPDTGFPSSKTYTNITFTKKIKFALPPNGKDTAIFGTGHIVGYCIDYVHNTDTTKYVHRWDFTVDFTDLRMYP